MKVDKCVILLALSLLYILYSVLAYREPVISFDEYEFVGVSARDLYVELPDIEREVLQINIADSDKAGLVAPYAEEPYVRYDLVEMEYIGTYFVTAYCPYECGGSWQTSSGATCHRADWESRYAEPTTVAIDRRYHSYGETFYIPEFDRVFVAEDTGSGVKGKWIDIFYEEYDDVLAFPTGSYEVYSVEVSEYTIEPITYEMLMLAYKEFRRCI